ncbi:MAG: phenylalanine--tRNA ligase subunit alpha [Candidatus Omnitrophota bacterium]
MSFDRTHYSNQAKAEIESCQDRQSLESLRVKYLGRKGVLQDLMSKIPTLPPEERKAYGADVNALKGELAGLLSAKEQEFSTRVSAGGPEAFVDLTLPGKRSLCGKTHPLTQVRLEICTTFQRLGFKIFQGPEIETEYNNFEALNIALEHPSRDAFDTFYIKSPQSTDHGPQNNRGPSTADRRLLLRSHTSPGQIRAMKAAKPPLAIVVPGKVYRPDAVDASHSFMFHQVEGFAVDKDIRFSDLKGVLLAFAREMFGVKTRIRFRPSFFPFTEPSAEVDISCIICGGQGCSVCKRSGWIEILGCGMIHPHVFESVGYDSRQWRGFAFGMGVERIAMLKFGIADIRLFFENDIRFLEQF